MKFKQYLAEEYFSRGALGSEIHKNPSKTQIKKLTADSKGRFRFAINFEKENIFFWDGDHATHWDNINSGEMVSEFPLGYQGYKYYCGYGFLRNNYIVHASDSFHFNDESINYLKSVHDDWTKYYFGVDLARQLLATFEKNPNWTGIPGANSLYKDEIINHDIYDLHEEVISSIKKSLNI